MRDLGKSVGSFSIAISLFGAQQAASWLRRPLATGRGDNTASNQGLDSVAHSTQGELTGPFRSAFEAGDRIQRSAVDLAFGLVDGSAWKPSRAIDLSADVVRQSVAAVNDLLFRRSRPCPARPCPEGEPCGWGPMPPAR